MCVCGGAQSGMELAGGGVAASWLASSTPDLAGSLAEVGVIATSRCSRYGVLVTAFLYI